jgi:hypothetical protein
MEGRGFKLVHFQLNNEDFCVSISHRHGCLIRLCQFRNFLQVSLLGKVSDQGRQRFKGSKLGPTKT